MYYFCIVETLYKLLKLEAIYGTPSQFTSTIDQLINYYKQVHTYMTEILVYVISMYVTKSCVLKLVSELMIMARTNILLA